MFDEKMFDRKFDDKILHKQIELCFCELSHKSGEILLKFSSVSHSLCAMIEDEIYWLFNSTQFASHDIGALNH